jgi:hypothetical protein
MKSKRNQFILASFPATAKVAMKMISISVLATQLDNENH